MNTPCKAACKNNDGICSGCYRTMDEIIQWRHFSDQQRDTIIANIQGIQTTHQCPSCQAPAQCDLSQGKQTCWCFDLEKRDTSHLKQGQACLCRQCLSEAPLA
ncbi:MAG: cysteine-rich CWC family protein [Pseudomonadota bacterium]